MRTITKKEINDFHAYLVNEEKADATIKKYMRDVLNFANWSAQREIGKELVLRYKTYLVGRYAPASVNSMISSLNSFFAFESWHELKVKVIRIQRKIFASTERELSKPEYEKMLNAAGLKKNKRLYLLMQTICSCGIRVSELKYITVESIRNGVARIDCKGKQRSVFLPRELCNLLKGYCREQKRRSGSIFLTRNGNPLDRSNIWSDMKRLCKAAGVSEKKVFPHNLRHLFARTYYSMKKDIVRLADILGHSSINTTRIYTMESGEIHRRQIQHLGLIRCHMMIPQNKNTT